ncbi:MAG: hypothetical protein IPG04_01030 [Polyangiaceae bacterium]|nr:hypothetical protein [Polyangiaceae bacterium]
MRGWAVGLSSLVTLAVASCGDDTSNTGGSGGVVWTGGAGGGGAPQGGGGGGGDGGAPIIGECLAFEGEPNSGSNTWTDGADQATVGITGAETCTRTYELSTTAPLRDNLPGNPRSIPELAGQPIVRTGNDMFDALYALAHAEARENSVDAISNFAFNGGLPIPCAAGGCFETGRLWTYVWTRDTAYAVALGLASLDPTRAKNSLELKTSLRRDGTRREIVQDTGTGGSWPVSTDRVVWAMGAWELLKYLDGPERTAFRDLAYEAITNTAERDRAVAFDPADGLYRGEQSFLDWREQTYPGWTANDTVQIAMSKALGTNVGHLRLLEVAAALAEEKGLASAAAQYEGWADDLRAAIRAELYLADEGLYSTYKTTALDAAPTRRFDLLGEAFAVLSGVSTGAEALGVIEAYPHLERGAPVAWPQQQDTAIYHNRALWPFVTAYWAKAAAKVGHAAATDHAVRSLMRGAALNLSNMENFEAATGAAWLDEGPTSGPVVNSQRQLWSVAGYIGVVQDVVFGLEASQTGLRFAPKISAELKASLFPGAESIALSNLRYRGRRVNVRVRLPSGAAGAGFYEVASVLLNGADVGTGFVDAADLADDNLFEVELAAGSGSAGSLTLLSDDDVADYRNVFGPKTPTVTSVAPSGAQLEVSWSGAGESGVTYSVYRDGLQVASGLSGTSWVDPSSGDHTTSTHCYSVASTFTSSGTSSQHARPICHWGAGNARIQTFGAQQFAAIGGSLVFNHGRWHYEDWGDPADTLTVASVTPTQSGVHLLQVVAGNGAGGFTTGVTCGVKAIEVWSGATLVGGGQLVMPHLEAWSEWRDSNVVRVTLTAGTPYTVIIREDAASGNMSDLDHFSLYGGTGGTGGRFNKVNIAELKLLAIGD